MKKTINVYDFMDAFQKMGRGENFSHEGLEALFHYIEEYEEDTEVETELDVIALCCDFTEYENIEEFWNDYDKDEYPNIESIQYHSYGFIPVKEEGFIIGNF